jgi:hypothetical protein
MIWRCWRVLPSQVAHGSPHGCPSHGYFSHQAGVSLNLSALRARSVVCHSSESAQHLPCNPWAPSVTWNSQGHWHCFSTDWHEPRTASNNTMSTHDGVLHSEIHCCLYVGAFVTCRHTCPRCTYLNDDPDPLWSPHYFRFAHRIFRIRTFLSKANLFMGVDLILILLLCDRTT